MESLRGSLHIFARPLHWSTAAVLKGPTGVRAVWLLCGKETLGRVNWVSLRFTGLTPSLVNV